MAYRQGLPALTPISPSHSRRRFCGRFPCVESFLCSPSVPPCSRRMFCGRFPCVESILCSPSAPPCSRRKFSYRFSCVVSVRCAGVWSVRQNQNPLFWNYRCARPMHLSICVLETLYLLFSHTANFSILSSGKVYTLCSL